MEHEIRNDALQILLENYNRSGAEQSMVEWVINESQSDPDFFRWLFMEHEMPDFFCPDKAQFNRFLAKIIVNY